MSNKKGGRCKEALELNRPSYLPSTKKLMDFIHKVYTALHLTPSIYLSITLHKREVWIKKVKVAKLK